MIGVVYVCNMYNTRTVNIFYSSVVQTRTVRIRLNALVLAIRLQAKSNIKNCKKKLLRTQSENRTGSALAMFLITDTHTKKQKNNTQIRRDAVNVNGE